MIRGLNLLILLGAITLTGCYGNMGVGKAGADLELGEPQLSLALKLDAEVYGVGAPIYAELVLTNEGSLPVTVGRPSVHTVEFFVQPEDDPEPRHTEQVSWALESPEFVVIEASQSHGRTIPLNLATAKPGSYTLFAIYRTEPVADMELAATVASTPVPIKVKMPVALERDGVGLITEEQAKRIALDHYEKGAARIDALLVKDERVQMFQWWVTVYFEDPEAAGKPFSSCFIDPFLGKVRSESAKPVDLSARKRSPTK